MIKRIFLDMDGVLSNFVSGVAEVFETTEEYLIENWEPGKYDVCHVLKNSMEDLWEMIDGEGEEFWEEMKPYSWAKELYEMCCSIAPTVILTSPSYNPYCLSGKLRWLNKNLGNNRSFRDFMISPRKEMAASLGHFLIDDSDSQCEKWFNNRGSFILFPRHWNTAFEHKHNPIDYVRAAFKLHGISCP